MLKAKYLPQKFFAIKSSLKPEVLNLWEQVRASGKQSEQAEFLNELFEKDSKGQWVVNAEKPYFKLSKERSHRVFCVVCACAMRLSSVATVLVLCMYLIACVEMVLLVSP